MSTCAEAFVHHPRINRECCGKDCSWRATKRNASSLMPALAESAMGDEKAEAGGGGGIKVVPAVE